MYERQNYHHVLRRFVGVLAWVGSVPRPPPVVRRPSSAVRRPSSVVRRPPYVVRRPSPCPLVVSHRAHFFHVCVKAESVCVDGTVADVWRVTNT